MTSANTLPGSIDMLTRAESRLCRLRTWRAFEPALEQQYEAYSSERRNRTLRFWLVFCLMLRVLGFTNEYAIGGEMLTYGLVLRFGILTPVVLLSLWFLSPRYSVTTQGVAATAGPLLCFIGIAVFGVIAPAPHEVRYFMLAGVTIIAINLVMPLRFQHALIFTCVSLCAYLAITFSGLGGLDPRSVADIVFLYSLAAIASLAVSYRNDVADRLAFLANEKISVQAGALARANEDLQRLLNADALTGVYNRRYLDHSLKRSGETAIADGTYLGVIMVDVDHFKAYNDALGHRAGDDCLREVARGIAVNVREDVDIVTRYGGEEFAVLVPGLSLEATEAVGERIRAAIEELQIPHPLAPHATVTVSVGIAAGIPSSAAVLDRMVEDADGALYRSKRLGRNRVTCASMPISPDIERTDDVKSAA